MAIVSSHCSYLFEDENLAKEISDGHGIEFA